MPITSYAPELLELFKKAALETIYIPLKDEKKAIRLRFRMNKLRKELRKAANPLCLAANGVQFQITPEGDLICKPADIDFLSALRQAGVTLEKVTTGLQPAYNIPSAPQMSAIELFLKEGENTNE